LIGSIEWWVSYYLIMAGTCAMIHPNSGETHDK